MKRSVLWMLALLVVAACGRIQQEKPPASPSVQQNRLKDLDTPVRSDSKAPKPAAVATALNVVKGSVIEVTDGDTVTFQGDDGKKLKVRLVGIDAPEGSQPCGDESTAALREMVLNHEVNMTPFDKDRYGRTLGVLEISGQSVNLAMVRGGHAWHFKRYSDDATLAKAEIDARDAGRGLWSSPDPIPPWNYRKDPSGVATAQPVTPVSTLIARPVANPVAGKNEAAANKNYGTRTEAIAFTKNLEQRFPELQPQQTQVTVYVTKTGSKYHSAGCRHLRKSSIAMDLSRAQGRYSACSVCGGGGHSSGSASPTRWTDAEVSRGRLEWTVKGTANNQRTNAIVFVDRNGLWKLRSLHVGRNLVFEDKETPSQSDSWTKKLAAAQGQAGPSKLVSAERPNVELREPAESDAAEQNEKAAGQLKMAKTFIARQKNSIAKRRLNKLIKDYPDSDAATEAAQLLNSLR